MHITEVELKGFSGLSRKVAIAPRQVFGGPNGVGKTAILRAILIALIEHDPALGKEKTTGLFTSRAGYVETTIDAEGRALKIRRGWTIDADGGIERVVETTPPIKSKTATAAKEWIKATFGDCVATLDISAFLKLTAGKRAEYLAGLPGAFEGSTPTLDAFFGAVKASSDLSPDDELRARFRSAWNPKGSISANLEAAILSVAAALKDANEAEKIASAAYRKAIDEIGEVAADSKSALVLREERANIQERIETARADLAADERNQAALKKAAEEVEAAEKVLADVEKTSDDVAKTLEEAKNLEAVRESELKGAEAAEAEIPKSGKTADKAKTAIVDDLRRTLDEAVRTSGKLRTELDELKRVEESFSLGSGGCPVAVGLICPSQGDVVGSISSKIEAKKAEILTAETLETDARAKFSVAIRERDDAERELARIEEARVLDLANAYKVTKAARTALREATAARSSAEIAAAQHSARVESAKNRIAAARQAKNETVGVIDAEDVKKQLDTLRALIITYDGPTGLIARAEKVRTLREQANKLEEDQTKAQARAKLYRAYQSAAKAEAGTMLAAALAPLTRAVDGLLDTVCSGWRLIVAAESGGVVLKAKRGAFVQPWETLSQGQQAIFTAALGLALVRLHNPPLKVLLLEAAEVDGPNLRALCDALSAMGKDFGSIVIASCHATADLPAGWSFTDLGKVVSV